MVAEYVTAPDIAFLPDPSRMAHHDLTEIGKYHIQDLVGEGAMGVVYRALDPVLNRHVAIKVMSDALARDEALRDRFLREARAAGSLQHPNVITIYDFGEVDGHLYIAMEFVEGSDLDVVLRTGTPLSLDEKLAIMTDVLNGLAYAHKRGVVHRDIKPANIRVDEEGHARIMDFGIAHLNTAMTKMTRTGMMLGTPNYMAPEQITGEEVSARTDIFAAGAVLYELLTNSRPFQADTLHAVLYKITSESPPSIAKVLPGLPSSLNDIVMRALAKDPGQRYATALEMANELTRVRQSISQAPRTAPSLHATIEHARSSGKATAVVPPPKKPDRRRVVFIGGGVAAAAAILAAIALSMKGGRQADPPSASLQGATTGTSVSKAAVVPSPVTSAPAGTGTTSAPSAAANPPATKQAPGADAPSRAAASGPSQAELDLVQTAKATATATRVRARANGVAPELLVPGDAHEQQGDEALRKNQIRSALEHYQSAGNAWSLAMERATRNTVTVREQPRGATTSAAPNSAPTTPQVVTQPVVQAPAPTSPPVNATLQPPPPNPQIEIQAVIASFARAIESREISELRRAYPGLTRVQQDRFSEFFSSVRSLHASFTVTNLDIDGNTAEAKLAGIYEFVSSSGRLTRQDVTFATTLKREGGIWRLATVR